MDTNPKKTSRSRFLRVTDEQGNQYACNIDHLKKFEELTDEEKAQCFGAPQHGPGE